MKKRLLVLAFALGLGVASLSACQKKVEKTEKVEEVVESATSAESSQEETKSKVVKLGAYKGIELNEVAAEATDEEVDDTIDYELLANSEEIEVTDRALEGGDIAVFDFEGKIDGVAFEGGTATDYSLQIGSGNFIAGFEDGMIGMNIGETKDLNLKFPENYKEDLAGKDVVFTVKLNAIKTTKKAELNDEFAKKVSNGKANTVEEYRELIRQDIVARKSENAKYETQNLAIDKIINDSEFDIDEAEFQKEVEKQVEAFKQTAENYGSTYEEFLAMNGMTEESFVEFAEKPMKIKLVIDAIAKEENLTVTDDYYNEISEKYSIPVEELKSKYADAVRSEYVVNYIYDNANIIKITDFNEINFETEASEDVEGETKAE